MTKASDNAFPSLLITEGTEPTAPAAGKQRLYIDSTTHTLHRTDSSGTEVDIETAGAGSVATDAIWDAAGDLVQGTGANTAAKLSAGTAGQVLKSAGAAAANVWGTPGEFATAYAAVATGQTTTSTTPADLATVGPSVTVTIGASGLAKVSVRLRMQNGTAGEYCVAYVTISGATTVAATSMLITVSGAIGSIYEVGATKIFTGLNAGSTTFKMQYSVQVAHGTNTFTSREIIVEPVL